MNPINDDEFIDDTVTQEDLTPLHSTPEGEQGQVEVGTDIQQEAGEVSEQPGTDEAGKRADFVPHAKFHQANERAKSERMARENAERRLDAILQAVNNQRGQQHQEPQQPVDDDPMPPIDDPISLTQWNARRIARMEQAQQQNEARTQQERETADLRDRVVAATRQDFSAYAAQDPSIEHAYNYLVSSRLNELAAQGFSEHDAQRAVSNEMMSGYHGALTRGQSPAAMVMHLARARGFVPQAQHAQGQGGGQQAAPQVSEDRRRMHTSLSSASGGEAPRPLTAKDLLAMDEDEFARVSDSVVNKLMKGNAA